VAWTRDTGVTGLEGANVVTGIIEANGTIVGIGGRQVDTPDDTTFPATVWWSTDGRAWTPQELPGWASDQGQLEGISTGPAGFVLIGDQISDVDHGSLWLSGDGHAWEKIQDDGFHDDAMRLVGSTDQGYVVFGSTGAAETGVIWTSPDGRDWLRATNDTGLEVAKGITELTDLGSTLVAFVHRNGGPVELWQTEGRAEWQQVGSIADSMDGVIEQAVHGPAGWYAFGTRGTGETPEHVAWRSTDGLTWTGAAAPENDVTTMIGVPGGFVAIDEIVTAEGCALPDNAFMGRTWVSTDGSAWRHTATTSEAEGTAIRALLERPDGLLGLGVAWDLPTSGGGIAPQGAVWTAPLAPAGGPQPTPEPTPTPESTGGGEGCGGG